MLALRAVAANGRYRLHLFYYSEGIIMTTISSSAPVGIQSSDVSGSSASGSSDNSTAAQIAQITKKISDLTNKLKEASITQDRTPEEKKKHTPVALICCCSCFCWASSACLR